jgi:hypothetical protein
MFDPGAPLTDELGFVKEQIFGPGCAGFALTPGVQDGVDPSELKNGVIKGGVKNVGCGDP